MSRQIIHKIIRITTLITTLSMIITTQAQPDTTVSEVICNPNTYGENDPYGLNLADTLSNLVLDTPDWPTRSMHMTGTDYGTLVFAFADCSQQMAAPDCSDCLSEAVRNVLADCVFSIGAEIILGDCALRYEDYPF